MFFKDKLKVY